MFTQDRVVSMHPYFKVSEGKWSHFSELCQQLVSMAAMEPKCLYYGFSFNGSEAFCREAYDGAEGLLTHLESVGPVLEQLLRVSEVTRLEVHGTEKELAKLVQPLSTLNPSYFTLRYGVRVSRLKR
jgi:hypothetical protein